MLIETIFEPDPTVSSFSVEHGGGARHVGQVSLGQSGPASVVSSIHPGSVRTGGAPSHISYTGSQPPPPQDYPEIPPVYHENMTIL